MGRGRQSGSGFGFGIREWDLGLGIGTGTWIRWNGKYVHRNEHIEEMQMPTSISMYLTHSIDVSPGRRTSFKSHSAQ